MPSPRASPFAKFVLPVPKSPERVRAKSGGKDAAKAAAKSAASAAEEAASPPRNLSMAASKSIRFWSRI